MYMTYELPVDAVQEQLQRCLELPFYRRWFDDHDVDPDAIDSTSAFRSLPVMDRATVLEALEQESGLYHPETSFIGFTPTRAAGFMPEYMTKWDMEASARAGGSLYAAAGVDEDDIVMNTFGYDYFGSAHLFQLAAMEAGAAVIPAGPGDTDRAVSIIEDHDVTTLISNPSFAMKLASRGVTSIETVIATGEPFSIVPGYREELVEAFDSTVTASDYFALSEVLPVACECEEGHGLHLATEYVYAEVIDPNTGEVLGPGERGELVLTHLQKESMPLLRYRTGDLTVIERVECDGEERLSLPRSVFGRVDDMTKVKGAKFFPAEIGPLLGSLDGLSGEYQVVLARDGGTDSITLRCEGEGNPEQVRRAVEAEIVQAIDHVDIVDELDAEETLIDERT